MNPLQLKTLSVKIFQWRFTTKLKDFAQKFQAKHRSTVVEPTDPFHRLVRVVDAKDVENRENSYSCSTIGNKKSKSSIGISKFVH